MHITFPQGKRVTFVYDGAPGRKARVLHGTGTHIARLPATHPRASGPPLQRQSVYESSEAETIEYIDPEGSEMN